MPKVSSTAISESLNNKSLVAGENGLDGHKQREVDEFFIGASVGPGGVEAELIAALIPEGDLFDGGLLQVGRERRLAGEDSGARY